jgi:hypothetical protein
MPFLIVRVELQVAEPAETLMVSFGAAAETQLLTEA